MLSVLPHMELDEWFTLRVYLAFPDLFNQKEPVQAPFHPIPPQTESMQGLPVCHTALSPPVSLPARLEHILTGNDRSEQWRTAVFEFHQGAAGEGSVPGGVGLGTESDPLFLPPVERPATPARGIQIKRIVLGLFILLEKGSPYEPYLIEQLYYLGKFRSAEKRTVSFSSKYSRSVSVRLCSDLRKSSTIRALEKPDSACIAQ